MGAFEEEGEEMKIPDGEIKIKNVRIENSKIILTTYSVYFEDCTLDGVQIEFIPTKWYDKYFKKIKSLLKL